MFFLPAQPGDDLYERMSFKQIFTIVSILMLAVGVWAFWLEPGSLHNKTYDLALPSWPAACAGVTVAVLSDLHVGSPFNHLDHLNESIDLTLRGKPDLILLAGDYVMQDVPGGQFVSPQESAAHLARLSAPMGVYAVLGNHDWWHDGMGTIAALQHAGIQVLEDIAKSIQVDGCQFWLAGISDFWEGAHDVSRALSRIPANGTILAFTHNPDIFPDVPSRVALTVAGHTHGGQVYLPFIGRPVVPSQYGERFAIGHIIEQGRHLFVTPGIGTSILPVRFLVPPEVSVLILHSA
jgi:predicted MPP superfamily phosphohydrolase